MWHRPDVRTKTGQPPGIALPTPAVVWLQKLKELACNAEHVLPPRALLNRMAPQVCASAPEQQHHVLRPA